MSLRVLLLAAFLGVIGLLAGLSALAIRGGLRADLLADQRSELEHALLLAELALRGAELEPPWLAGELAGRAGARVTIVGADGSVLGDSEVSPLALDQIENYGSRPEVVGAMAGELTFTQRRSGTTGLEIFYAATPVEFNGERMVLRLGRPLERVDVIVAATNRDLLRVALLAFVLCLVAVALLGRAVTHPLASVSLRAQRLGAGELGGRERAPSRIAEIDALERTFHRLSEEIEGRVRELLRDRDDVQAVIESIAEGVIALSDDARVVRINRAATGLLDISRPLPFAPVGTLVRQPDLRDLLEEAVLRPFESREVLLGEKSLLVSSRLLDGGAVVTLLDVSELRRVERVRRDFVANASHELKTPLTAVRGFAEALLEEDPPEDLRNRFLESIRVNTLRLQNLVDDLLDLSRLESGEWRKQEEALSLAEVAQEVWAELPEDAGREEISFAISGDATVAADRRALYQIFRNLLENALRYTSPGGSIGVVIRERAGWVSVAVTDDGSGIPSTALPRIFERFYRADPSRARVAGGSGLGLAIVRHLVSTMGGSVGAESELGVGTTIHFRFPTQPRTAAQAPDPPEGARPTEA